MATRDPLVVFLRGRPVAELLDTGFGDTALRYLPDALDDPARSRLSLSLPVQEETYGTHGPGGRWVRSLLPEGRALEWAVAQFHVPVDDKFGLAAVLGRDVAGAAQILPAGEQPDGGGRYEPIAADDLVQYVTRADRVPLGLDRERGVRLSLAGMQDKVVLHREDDDWLVPLDGAPSTVILKPAPPPSTEEPLRFDGIATNEALCLRLARLVGLSAADATIQHFGDRPTLVVRRFDRERAGAVVVRRHQEDLLGVMGQDPLLKYERPQAMRIPAAGGFAAADAVAARVGPTLRDLAAGLEPHVGRTGLVTVFDAVVFNVLIGNADAHARNYSVLLDGDGTVELAPLYDVVSTRLWPQLDAEPAQLIAGVDHLDRVTADDLVAEAASWGLPERVSSRRVNELGRRLTEHLSDAVESVIAGGGEERVAEELLGLIRARTSTVLGSR